MLLVKRGGAALLMVGLVLPYACDVRPITGVWSEAEAAMMVGLPVLATLAYVLHTLLPPIARFHERIARPLHGVLRAMVFGLAGAYVITGLRGEGDQWPFWTAAIAGAGALLYWQQRRGAKADRLPLLLLTVVAFPAVYYFFSAVDTGDLQVGGWIFTAGFLAAVIAEVGTLRRAPPITHSG